MKENKPRKTVLMGVVLAVIPVAVVISTVSYTAILWFGVALMAGMLFRPALRLVRANPKKASTIVVLAYSAYSLPLFRSMGVRGGGAGTTGLTPIKQSVTLRWQKESNGAFIVHDVREYAAGVQELAVDTVSSVAKGFALREVSWSAGRDSTAVEIPDLPVGMFVAAKDAEDLTTNRYLETESVTWVATRRNVVFAYVPAPFHRVAWMIKPFIGVNSPLRWVLASLGVLGALIVGPALLDLVKDRVKHGLESVMQRRGAPVHGKAPAGRTKRSPKKSGRR